MLTPLQILDQVRAARTLRPQPAPPTAQDQPAAALGAPPHLVPGKVVLDPVTGQTGEVLAYGRAHTIAPATPGAGA
jgi:hypothetical protein